MITHNNPCNQPLFGTGVQAHSQKHRLVIKPISKIININGNFVRSLNCFNNEVWHLNHRQKTYCWPSLKLSLAYENFAEPIACYINKDCMIKYYCKFTFGNLTISL